MLIAEILAQRRWVTKWLSMMIAGQSLGFTVLLFLFRLSLVTPVMVESLALCLLPLGTTSVEDAHLPGT